MLPASTAESRCLSIRFGAADGPGLPVALPVLGGELAEDLFPEAREIGAAEGFQLFQQGHWLLGRTSVPATDCLESSVRQVYGALLRVAHGRALVRIWNYVPGINQPGVDGLERYRAFSRGRSHVFEHALGPAFGRHAPSASAVGCEGDGFVVAFAAFAGPARHVENPRQTPAYEYPLEHGPRPPTFARATLVDVGGDACAVFISGTAAIRGHGTVAPGQTQPQLECTIENLREISRSCGLGPDLGAGRGARHFKIYVRHASDLSVVQRRLEETILRPDDRIAYLRSDICRHDLNVEIEVSLPLLRLGQVSPGV